MEFLKCNPQWVRKPQQVMADVLAGMQFFSGILNTT